MSLQVWETLEQGTPEWIEVRRGVLTASTVGRFITPKTVKLANNDTSRGLTMDLVGERVTGRVETFHMSDAMMRGILDEPLARDVYAKHFAPVTEIGFMIREINGMKLGYSPDGLVGNDGLIEIKSRAPKKHIATVISDEVPAENMAQLQAGLLVSGREWCDYISYCGGEPLYRIRVLPNPAWQEAIITALATFETNAQNTIEIYTARTVGLPTTEYINHFEETEMSL